MNQSLENPSVGEVSSAQDAPAADGGGECLMGAPDEVKCAASKKGRVLLLESNPCFRETVRAWLVEDGYEVVAVQNSQDGLREVLADDFALVLCDSMMPGLPGDKFYQAVKRIDGALCERFVFTINDLSDPGMIEFIKNVSGVELWKPFEAANLVEAIAATGQRRNPPGGSESRPKSPVPAPVFRPVTEFPTVGVFFPKEPARVESPRRILPRPKPEPAPAAPSVPVLAEEPQLRPGGISPMVVVAGMALLFVVAVTLWNLHLDARDAAAAAWAKRRAAEVAWTVVSPQLEAAVAVRSKIESAERQAAQVSADRAKPHWAPLLRGFVPPGDARIELVDLDARGRPGDMSAAELQIRGVARGTTPRLTADRFRMAVEEHLKRNATGRMVSVRFEELNEVADAIPDRGHADFVMVVTVRPSKPAVAMSKEGQ